MVSPPAGIIITVSVLVAASLAAYENPHVRAWIDRTRQKIAMSLHSLGDEIHPAPRSRQPSNDASMHEEKGEMAEARRRQAIAEIMERGRMMEERRKRRKLSDNGKSSNPSFDNLVDENGTLRSSQDPEPSVADASGVDRSSEHMRQRGVHSESKEPHESVDDALPLRHLPSSQGDKGFESRYEQEMREAWNIPLSDRRIELPSSHASESLIDLTPTTENAPDPEISIPSAEYLHRQLEPSDYFSAAASNSTHTLSDHDSASHSIHLDPPRTAVRPISPNPMSPSLPPSVNGSMSSIHASEADDSSDGMLSEIGDGIRTPASVWTDVGSTVSGEHHL